MLKGRETDAEKRWRARALRCQAVQSPGARHADIRNDFRPPGRGPAMEGAKLIPSLLSYFGSARTEDRAASEAVHCWGRRMSFNVSSHKISGLRSPALTSAMSFVAMACLMSSSQSPVRRAMQTISSATLRTRVLSGSNRSPLRNGMIGMACSLITGGSAMGLSATDAWAQGPLSVISGPCAYSRGSASHFKGP